MTNKLKQIEKQSDASVFSIRVSQKTKLRMDQILAEINGPFGKKRVTGEKLIALLPDLLSEEIKHSLRKEARTGEEEREIWRQIHLKKLGPITRDGFLKFMMSPAWVPFMEKHRTDFEKLA